MRVQTALLVLIAAAVPLQIGATSGSTPPQRPLVHAQPAAGCTVPATKIVVRDFVRDYARGRIGAIDRLWAPAPRFQWFSTGRPGARLGRRAYDRATLMAYFRRRIHAHEKLRLIRLGAGYDRTRRIVNFSGRLVRSADDAGHRPAQDFKGAADCVSGRPILIVWSM
jgi:hypothetical protein